MTQQLLPNPDCRSRLFFIQTMGCQMNEYDSLRVQRMLSLRGWNPTSEIAEADLIFLNTCSVREKAEQKVHSFLGRLRKLKTVNPELKIVVAGCVAQQLGKDLLERFTHIDLVLGTRAIGALPGLLDQLEMFGARTAHMPDEEETREEPCGAPFPFNASVSAPVTIMQGCNNFCTYCIVPYVRGRERSRPSGEVIREIDWLARGGVREILLLGQNVNSYGRGLDEDISFADLLRRIAAETDISRIRFTTSHPKDLTDELIRCFAEIPVLCGHLHLPFQAGSDAILERMHRGYTAAQYIKKIDKLRNAAPDIAMSSDAMVGFPGETVEEFHKTLQLLEEIRFDSLFSFRYSDRPFAKSSRLPNKISYKVKAARLAELQALQMEITMERSRAEIGRIRDVLVEGPSKTGDGQFTGRTEQNRVVNFDGSGVRAGDVIQVRILDAFSHSLKGEVVLGHGL